MDANDIPLSGRPAESCCNCGFLSKSAVNTDGSNESLDMRVVAIERDRGFLENGPAYGGKRFAWPVCWMRQGVLEAEHDESLRALRNDRMEADRVVIHRDRSADGDAYCPQYVTWVPHLTFREHWEERKMLRLERQRQKWEETQAEDRKEFEKVLANSANKPQWWLVGISVLALLVALVLGVGSFLFQGGDTTNYYGVTPTPLSTPDTASPQSTPTS